MMQLLKLNASGSTVLKLQHYLTLAGFPTIETGVFDEQTKVAVEAFQEQKQLGVDGIVGKNTWGAIFKTVYTDDFFSAKITNKFLQHEEVYHRIYPKNAIYLHHTAGHYNPLSTIRWWETGSSATNNLSHIATAFVIGRKSSLFNKEDEQFDGKTYRCFNEIKWAHHLGKKGVNYELDKSTIGLEICSFGWLYNDEKGFYYQANKKKNSKKVYLREEEVCQFERPWRGQRFFEKYTAKQIQETERLVLTLAYLFDIQLPNRAYDESWFELQDEALKGGGGLWTHVNVRKDKTDCFPQTELIEMLNTLHNKQQDFKPILKEVIETDSLESEEAVLIEKSVDLDFRLNDFFRSNDLEE